MNAGYLPARLSLAEALLNDGQIEDSRAEISAILETQPESLQGRLLKAALDRSEGNTTEAEQALTSMLTDQPDNPLVHQQMAQVNESRGDIAGAERSFQRVLELQSNSPESFQNLAQFYIRQGMTDRAIQTLNTVPDDRKEAIHYELIGLAHLQAGQFDDSERAYQEALAKDPSRTVSHNYLTAQYIQTGRIDDALNQLDELIRLNPSDANAIGTKGLIYENEGSLAEAKDQYTQALDIDPEQVAAANNLAYILAEQGQDLDTALRWAQVGRRNRPNDPSTADTLGWVYYKLGNYVLAIDQFQFAVSQRPDHGVFQYHLGRTFMETGQLSEAQIALERALAADDFEQKELAEAALEELSRLQ